MTTETTPEPLCNLCGLTCIIGQPDSSARGPCGLLGAFAEGGYDSTPGNGEGALDDQDRYTFNLCEFCLDHIFGQFVIPPRVEWSHADGSLSPCGPWEPAVERAVRRGKPGPFLAEWTRRYAARKSRGAKVPIKWDLGKGDEDTIHVRKRIDVSGWIPRTFTPKLPPDGAPPAAAAVGLRAPACCVHPAKEGAEGGALFGRVLRVDDEGPALAESRLALGNALSNHRPQCLSVRGGRAARRMPKTALIDSQASASSAGIPRFQPPRQASDVPQHVERVEGIDRLDGGADPALPGVGAIPVWVVGHPGVIGTTVAAAPFALRGHLLGHELPGIRQP